MKQNSVLAWIIGLIMVSATIAGAVAIYDYDTFNRANCATMDCLTGHPTEGRNLTYHGTCSVDIQDNAAFFESVCYAGYYNNGTYYDWANGGELSHSITLYVRVKDGGFNSADGFQLFHPNDGQIPCNIVCRGGDWWIYHAQYADCDMDFCDDHDLGVSCTDNNFHDFRVAYTHGGQCHIKIDSNPDVSYYSTGNAGGIDTVTFKNILVDEWALCNGTDWNCAPASQPPTPEEFHGTLTNGLVAHYDDSGVNTVSGSFQGTPINSPAISNTDCLVGSCMEFNGTNFYQVSDMGSFLDAAQNFTVSLWVKKNPENLTCRSIFGDWNTNHYLMALPQSSCTWSPTQGVVAYYDGGLAIGSDSTPISDNTWLMITHTHNKDALSLRDNVFYDNYLEYAFDGRSVPMSKSSDGLGIGGTYTSTGNDDWFGKMDEVDIWNRPLTKYETACKYYLNSHGYTIYNESLCAPYVELVSVQNDNTLYNTPLSKIRASSSNWYWNFNIQDADLDTDNESSIHFVIKNSADVTVYDFSKGTNSPFVVDGSLLPPDNYTATISVADDNDNIAQQSVNFEVFDNNDKFTFMDTFNSESMNPSWNVNTCSGQSIYTLTGSRLNFTVNSCGSMQGFPVSTMYINTPLDSKQDFMAMVEGNKICDPVYGDCRDMHFGIVLEQEYNHIPSKKIQVYFGDGLIHSSENRNGVLTICNATFCSVSNGWNGQGLMSQGSVYDIKILYNATTQQFSFYYRATFRSPYTLIYVYPVMDSISPKDFSNLKVGIFGSSGSYPHPPASMIVSKFIVSTNLSAQQYNTNDCVSDTGALTCVNTNADLQSKCPSGWTYSDMTSDGTNLYMACNKAQDGYRFMIFDKNLNNIKNLSSDTGRYWSVLRGFDDRGFLIVEGSGSFGSSSACTGLLNVSGSSATELTGFCGVSGTGSAAHLFSRDGYVVGTHNDFGGLRFFELYNRSFNKIGEINQSQVMNIGVSYPYVDKDKIIFNSNVYVTDDFRGIVNLDRKIGTVPMDYSYNQFEGDTQYGAAVYDNSRYTILDISNLSHIVNAKYVYHASNSEGADAFLSDESLMYFPDNFHSDVPITVVRKSDLATIDIVHVAAASGNAKIMRLDNRAYIATPTNLYYLQLSDAGSPDYQCLTFDGCMQNGFKQCLYSYDPTNHWAQSYDAGLLSSLSTEPCCYPNWSPVYYNGVCFANDTGNIFKYYVDLNNCNLNFGLPNDNNTVTSIESCNYCSEAIRHTDNGWTSCDGVNQSLFQYYVDDNYGSCCAITGLPSDCHITNVSNYPSDTIYRDCSVSSQQVQDVSLPENVSTQVSFLSDSVVLDIVPSGNYVGNVTVTDMPFVPEDVAPLPVTRASDFSKIIDITFDPPINENLTSMEIRIYYSDADVAGMDESTLGLLYYNETAAEWQAVNGSQVNMVYNYVYATVHHASLYGITGLEQHYTPRDLKSIIVDGLGTLGVSFGNNVDIIITFLMAALVVGLLAAAVQKFKGR